MRDCCRVHVVDLGKVEDNDADGGQVARIGDAVLLAEPCDTPLTMHRPVSVGLCAVEGAVCGCVMGLDGLKDRRLQPVSVGEEERLVEMEDPCVVRQCRW